MPALATDPWHEPLWQRLAGLHRSQRLPHAILLSGPRGIGKQGFAEALSALLLCMSPVNDLACGQCKSCRLWLAESHPDCFRLLPETDPKTGKTSRVIKVDQVRSLCEFLSKSAQFNGWRVATVEPADALNMNSANSLLKTLEEPGPRTALILLTDQPLGLLPTIRSRCQHFPLTLPDVVKTQTWLASRITDPRQAMLLLQLADGAPYEALRMATSEGFQRREELVTAMLAILKKRQGPIAAAAGFQKMKPEELFQTLHTVVADIILVRLSQENRISNTDLLPLIKELASFFELKRIQTIQAECLDSLRLLPANIQPGLLADRFWQSLRG